MKIKENMHGNTEEKSARTLNTEKNTTKNQGDISKRDMLLTKSFGNNKKSIAESNMLMFVQIPQGNYHFGNCRFIEMLENCSKN